jgi:hypothetical protein
MAIFQSDILTMVVAHLRANHRRYVKRLSITRWVLTGLAVVLGFIGFGGLIWPHSFAHKDLVDAAQHWTDAWYSTLGLLTLHLPRKFEQPELPWELQFARLLLPAMAVWLSVIAYFRLTQQRLRFFSLFRLSDHLVVTGPGARAHDIARLCKGEDEKNNIVYITEQEDNPMLADLHAIGIVIVRGPLDATDTYERAGLIRARAIVIAGDRVIDNIRACETIRSATLEKRSADIPALSLVAAIDSPEMAAILDATFHEVRDRRIEYRLLDPLDNIAQGLTRRLLPLLGSPNAPPAIVMIGWAGPAPAIYRRLLRNAPPGLELVLADRNADLTKAALLASAPGLAEIPGLQFIPSDTGASLLACAPLADALRCLPVGAIIISGDSDEVNFHVAVQLRRFARARNLWTPPIYVRQQGGDIVLDSLKHLIVAETIDVSRIYAFGSVDEQYAPAAVLHQIEDSMARVIHEDFLRGPYGSDPGPSTVPWDALMETFRSASRAQADHIDVKLANVGCGRVPKQGGAEFTFSDDEIERLAALEHWRWCVDRWLDGWTYGPKKRVELLQHDLLVAYEKLEDQRKEQDRKPVRNLPMLLALTNEAIEREREIRVDSARISSPLIVDEIAGEVEGCKRAGQIPIIVLRLANPADLALAQKLQHQGIPIRLEIAEQFGVLAALMPTNELVFALDAAQGVIAIPPLASPPPESPPQDLTAAAIESAGAPTQTPTVQ